MAAVSLQLVTLHWYFTDDLREVTHRFGDRTATSRVFTYDAAFAAFDEGLDELRLMTERSTRPGAASIVVQYAPKSRRQPPGSLARAASSASTGANTRWSRSGASAGSIGLSQPVWPGGPASSSRCRIARGRWTT